MTRVGQRLRVAIMNCCDARGDSDAYLAELLVGAGELPESQHADLAEHFEREARAWAAVSLKHLASGSVGSSRGASETGNSLRALGLFTDLSKGVVP